MTGDPRKYLCDIRTSADFIVNALADRLREELDHDLMLRFAVERALITVGEALNQLHRIAPETAEQIDRWKDIIGFRNILVHGYSILDRDVVWDIAKNNIPRLIVKIDAMLERES